MPRVTRVFIKTGLIFFLLSLLLGVALAIDALKFPALVPLFWHLLMVGWITQIIFGVSLWMFPGRTREEGFIAQKWAWLTYFLLNGGLLLRVIAEPFLNISQAAVWDILIVISAATQVLAAITYTIEMWPRIQSKSSGSAIAKRNVTADYALGQPLDDSLFFCLPIGGICHWCPATD